MAFIFKVINFPGTVNDRKRYKRKQSLVAQGISYILISYGRTLGQESAPRHTYKLILSPSRRTVVTMRLVC